MGHDAISNCHIPGQHYADFQRINGNINALMDLIERHGASQIACAGHNVYLKACCAELKERIAASELPQFMKDAAHEMIDGRMQEHLKPVSPTCCDEFVDTDLQKEMVAQGGKQAEDLATPTHEGSAGGGHSVTASDADGAIATSRIGGSSEEERGNSSGSGAGNWLLALARKLAYVQDVFLTQALNSLDVMQANADAMNGDSGAASATEGVKRTPGGDKGAFLEAQARFQASMQMFNMMANMTATSLKSLGEGLTAVARRQ